MDNRRTTMVMVGLTSVIICVLGGLLWINYQYATRKLGGDSFYIHWLATREFVTQGKSPYSESTQSNINDQLNNISYIKEPKTYQYIAPVYSSFIFLPFALISNVTLAYALWITSLEIILIINIFIGFRLTGWRPGLVIFALLVVFSIFGYQAFIPLFSGSLAVLSLFFIELALLAIRFNRDELGGILLAFSTIHFPLISLTLIGILIWAISLRKKLLILWFFGCMFFLILIGIFLIPDWLTQYLRILMNYEDFFKFGTPGVLFKTAWPGIGTYFGWILTFISIILLLFEWWLAKRKNFRWMLWTICLTITISQWSGIQVSIMDMVSFNLPFLMVFAIWAERWQKRSQWIIGLSMIIIFIIGWASFYIALDSAESHLPMSLFFIFPLILIFGLYWVRWWAIVPRKLLVDEFIANETL